MKIICADDVYYNNEALRVIFENLGLGSSCHFFSNGREVVDFCKHDIKSRKSTSEITVIILDEKMLEMDGIDAIKEIASTYSIQNHRIQAMHAMQDEEIP